MGSRWNENDRSTSSHITPRVCDETADAGVLSWGALFLGCLLLRRASIAVRTHKQYRGGKKRNKIWKKARATEKGRNHLDWPFVANAMGVLPIVVVQEIRPRSFLLISHLVRIQQEAAGGCTGYCTPFHWVALGFFHGVHHSAEGVTTRCHSSSILHGSSRCGAPILINICLFHFWNLPVSGYVAPQLLSCFQQVGD